MKTYNAIRGIALAAFVAALAPPVWAMSPGDKIDVNGWKIGWNTKDDGSFKNCVAAYVYDDKSTFGLAIWDARSGALVINDPAVKMDTTQKYMAKLTVDGQQLGMFEGLASDPTTLAIPLVDRAPVFEAISNGSKLLVEAGGYTLTEPLGGSGDALVALDRCVSAATH